MDSVKQKFDGIRAGVSQAARALVICGVLVGFALMLCVTPSEAASQTKQTARRSPRPNILIFLTDDQRIGTLKHMPATRRLIERKGTTFKNAFATTPLCCPSRASIMTGQYAHNHGVRVNGRRRRLNLSHTLQHNLHEAGYRTGVIGKFLNGWNPAVVPPDFDQSVLLTPFKSSFAPPGTDAYTDSQFSINGRVKRVRRYATDFLRAHTGRILRRFNRSDRRPWLVYVNPYAPHPPAIPASRHADARVGGLRSNPALRERNRRDKAPEVRRSRVDQPWVRFLAKQQKRTLLAVDELVAKAFKKLRRLKEDRRTLVLFLSDNGMMWGEHGLLSKRWPYKHSIQIPMLMRWPGHVRPNTTVGRMVANIDVAPTVYDAARVTPDHTMDGKSLLSRSRRRSLLLEHWEGKRWLSVLSRRHQYIEYYNRKGSKLRFKELYNLKRDPWQLDNVLHRRPRRHREMARRMHALLVRKSACRGVECS